MIILILLLNITPIKADTPRTLYGCPYYSAYGYTYYASTVSALTCSDRITIGLIHSSQVTNTALYGVYAGMAGVRFYAVHTNDLANADLTLGYINPEFITGTIPLFGCPVSTKYRVSIDPSLTCPGKITLGYIYPNLASFNLCTPDCTGKDCGDNGCGTPCGDCAADETCEAGTCQITCIPDCEGKDCGDDGCGGSCGDCAAETCDNSIDDDGDSLVDCDDVIDCDSDIACPIDCGGIYPCEVFDDTQDNYNINGNIFDPNFPFELAIDGIWHDPPSRPLGGGAELIEDPLSFAKFKNPLGQAPPPIIFMYNKPTGFLITKAEWKVQYYFGAYGGTYDLRCFIDSTNSLPLHSPSPLARAGLLRNTVKYEIPSQCLSLEPIKLSLVLNELEVRPSYFNAPLLYEEGVIWTLEEQGGPQLDCSTINCADYDITNCPNNDCCFWNTEPMTPECSIVVGSGAKYCKLDGYKHSLELCDGIELGGETCESQGFVSGTLSCDEFCKFDNSLCNTGVTCGPPGGVEECSHYTGDTFNLCELDGTEQACTVGPCYIDGTDCEICLDTFLCSEYQTLTKCGANSCKEATGLNCKWEGDELTGYCIENEEFTEVIGTEVCSWNCAATEWSNCIEGIRQTSDVCVLSSDNDADNCGGDQVKQVSCRITKKFPFFSANGIIIVLILLIGYYIFVNSNKKKK